MKKYSWHVLLLPTIYFFLTQSAHACLGSNLHINITNKTSSDLYAIRKDSTEAYSSPFHDLTHLAQGQTITGHICFSMISNWGGIYELSLYRDQDKKDSYATVTYANEKFSSSHNPAYRHTGTGTGTMTSRENGGCDNTKPNNCQVYITLRDHREKAHDGFLAIYASKFSWWLMNKLAL